jgi:hypothetical protein
LVCCAFATIAVGRTDAYVGVLPYVGCWATTGLAAIIGWRAAQALQLPGTLEQLIGAAVAAFASILLCTAAAGVVGILAFWSVLAGQIVLAIWLVTLTPYLAHRPQARGVLLDGRGRPDPVLAAPMAIAGSIVVLAIAYGTWYSPLTLYDSVSYHLHFAARWVQDGALEIIPTPFSDIPGVCPGERRALVRVADAAVSRRPVRAHGTAAARAARGCRVVRHRT